MHDYQKYKNRIGDYLSRHVQVVKSGKDQKIRCLVHDDSNPSAIIYSDRLWCPVCDQFWDIYDCVELLENESDRAKQFKIIEKEFGAIPVQEKKQESKTESATPVPLEYEKARNIFSISEFEKLGKLMNLPTEQMTAFPYYDRQNRVVIVDVRFQNEKRKDVISFYWDGSHVKAKGCPVVLYGINLLDEFPEKPVLIVEGAKTAKIAQEKLPEFVVITWNGGSKKASLAPWNEIKDREVFIYPDDDQKKRDGKLLPEREQPGLKAAIEIQKILPSAKIIRPIPEARLIKEDGSDLEEAFEAVGVEFVREYLKSESNLWSPKHENELPINAPPKDPPKSNHDKIGFNPFPDSPFRVLGIADDGRGYFLNNHTGRLYDFGLDSLSAQKMFQIADIDYWTETFPKQTRGKSTGVEWELVYNAIIQDSNRKEFIPENLRGRGAWREPDGRICYHDGKETIGEYSKERVFIRKTRQQIGIEKEPLPEDRRNEIRAHIEKASFESKLDAIRLLGWSALAPFAGALPWRPAAMLTAPPGSGKTTILTKIIKPLTKPVILNGGESTPAGIRQIVARDSTAILLDEIEDDTKKKKEIREEIFSMMRQSTSDEAPITAKGTADQKGISYNMKNMFFFSAISNLIESKADDSRIFKINLSKSTDKPASYWTEWNKGIREMLDDDTCDRIRSHTWKNLTKILKNAQLISDIMQEVSKRDSRQSYADSMLFSAYFTTWERPNIPAEEFQEKVRSLLIEIFAGHHHDEAEEADEEPESALEKIMSHRIMMSESRREYSIREALFKISPKFRRHNPELTDSMKEEITNSLMRYGIKIQPDESIAIRIKHPDIARITERGQMYHKSLQRHHRAAEKRTKPVYYPGGTARAVIFNGIVSEEIAEIGLMLGG